LRTRAIRAIALFAVVGAASIVGFVLIQTTRKEPARPFIEVTVGGVHFGEVGRISEAFSDPPVTVPFELRHVCGAPQFRAMFVDFAVDGETGRSEAKSVAVGYEVMDGRDGRFVLAQAGGRVSEPPPWATLEVLSSGRMFASVEPPPEAPMAPTHYWFDAPGWHAFATSTGTPRLETAVVRDLLSGAAPRC
jgi:hypothetical protein